MPDGNCQQLCKEHQFSDANLIDSSSKPKVRCKKKVRFHNSSYPGQCSDSTRGDGKQISYSFTSSVALNFVCSGTAQSAFSGGEEAYCPLSDDYFAEEASCMNNCNNQGSCMGETARKCYCYEGWTGTHCETRLPSVFNFAVAELPAYVPATATTWAFGSSSKTSKLWISPSHILGCLLLLLATTV